VLLRKSLYDFFLREDGLSLSRKRSKDLSRRFKGNYEWDENYKVRTTVERSINHIKDSFCLAGRKTQNETTIHADLLLAGIAQLLGVLLADKIHQHQYLRSLKPLIA
jgi:hypothetical protein